MQKGNSARWIDVRREKKDRLRLRVIPLCTAASAVEHFFSFRKYKKIMSQSQVENWRILFLHKGKEIKNISSTGCCGYERPLFN